MPKHQSCQHDLPNVKKWDALHWDCATESLVEIVVGPVVIALGREYINIFSTVTIQCTKSTTATKLCECCCNGNSIIHKAHPAVFGSKSPSD